LLASLIFVLVAVGRHPPGVAPRTTIPWVGRFVASVYLLARRWWRRAGAFILTWAASEIVLTALKAWFHRGRPTGGLKWEWFAVGFAFVMAFSRVYLNAHWFSDVVAGVLLGSGIAIGAAAFSIEVSTMMLRRRTDQPPVVIDG
jgi:membrane-associated phospholipid phosphatase